MTGKAHAFFIQVVTCAAVSLLLLVGTPAAKAEELPWKNAPADYGAGDCSASYGGDCPDDTYAPEQAYPTQPPYQPPPQRQSQPQGYDQGYDDQAVVPRRRQQRQQQYEPAPQEQYVVAPQRQESFSPDEITAAGHRFFGNVTKGLASVIEYAFQQQGRPNGYILGEEGGGAFIAGLRYGEGVLHTKRAGRRRVYWQGPSIGYDFGAEGSKTMILVYDMYSPDEVFYHYAGVDGSAYLIGGVGVTFMKSGHVTMAPIRSGLGVRLGANVGYLKFTRSPTWNPF